MDHGDGRRLEREEEATTAVNAEYTATSQEHAILIRKLSDTSSGPYSIRFGSATSHCRPVLAFHPIRLNLLAASNGSQLVIFDVEAQAAKHIFKGNGRIITSISFEQKAGESLATGTADGTICVWSLKETSRPLHLLRGVRNACSHVAIHPNFPNVLSAVHGSHMSVWRLPRRKPITTIRIKPATLQLFAWCSEDPARILTVSHGGIISLYNLKNALYGSAMGTEDSDEEDGFFTRPNSPHHATSCTAFNLASSIARAQVFGQNGLVILPSAGKDVYFYNYSMDHRNMTELWRLHKEVAIEGYAFRRNGNTIEIMVISEGSVEVYRVPPPVLDSMGWSNELHSLPSHFDVDEPTNQRSASVRYGSMRPQKKARIRSDESKAPRLKPKPRMRRSAKDTPVKHKSHRAKQSKSSRPTTPTTQSMTSSLELLKERPNKDGDDSPMPFLSPNIPARKASPGSTTPLDESIQLPPLALVDTTAPVIDYSHESDSDDETFAGDMKNSATFLPGGVNVPLPKTCGALFAPNGQLITFFPYNIKRSIKENHADSKSPTGANKHGEEVNGLFPGFGNLITTSSLSISSSHSDSDGESTTDAPRFAIHPSSFDRKPSWPAKTSPLKQNIGPLPGDHRVTVSVRNMESVTPTRQALADTYELLPREGISNADLCRENASRAAKEGFHMSAGAWRLLAIIIEPRIVSPLELDRFGDVSAIVFGQRPAVSRTTSMASSRDGSSAIAVIAETFPLLQLPFGRTWAVEQLFTWADARADVQLLACMSSLLARTCVTLKETARRLRHRQSSSVHPNLLNSTALDSTMLPPGVPSLRTENIGTTLTTDSSPNKPSRSRISSGNPSQPTTPYLDSNNSTPPFTFSNLARQSSKLSISGSASPEHHRSSFSAAAKNYAASIAEKFGSYGSSPPLKKLGTSPGNELSSSLPNGSWSKSVSFASTMEPSKSSQRSLSLAQEDDNYDSDRTVEDASVATTPKKPGQGVSTIRKRGNFYDEKATQPTQASMPIISEQLATKCSFWRQHYADQLLSWDMLIEAGEMSNVMLSSPAKTSTSEVGHDEQHVAPQAASGRRFNDCCICFCIVHAAEQVCPACLHVTHPNCLDDLLSALGPANFTCPTGCGCDCTSAVALSFASDEMATDEEDAEQKLPFKKRPGLTDPLRLRQRLQGESW